MDRYFWVMSALVCLTGWTLAGQVKEIHVKTRDCDSCQMIPIIPGVDLEIFENDLSACSAKNLNYKAGGFDRDSIDAFHGFDLESCDGFEAPDNKIGIVQLFHHYTDAWGYDWVRIYFDDNSFVHCPSIEGGSLDNATIHTLTCA